MATNKSLLNSARWFAASLLLMFAAVAPADAADRPNRSTPTDVAAGRWMDSLLDPSTPLPKSKRAKRPRQRPHAQRQSNLRGKLVRNPDTEEGLPAYALVDRYGGVLRYVEPVKSIDLEKHLEQTVAVRHDTGDMLLASQLVLPRIQPGQPNSPTGLQLAQSLEPIPAGEPVPADGAANTPTPTEGVVEGPIYIDGGFEGGYDEGLNFGGCANCGEVICGCGAGGCGYGARGVMYLHAEYLLWRLEGMNTPPLVLQFNDIVGGVAQGPFTTLYGGNRVLEDERHGARITFGLWLDDYGQWGVEGEYLALGDLDETFSAGTLDGTVPAVGSFIGRPFFNTGVIVGPPASNPGAAVQDVDTSAIDGTVTVGLTSEFRSAGFRLRHNLCCRPSCETCCGDGVCCGAGVGCGSGVGPGVIPFAPLNRLCTLLRQGTRHTDILYGFRWVGLDEGLVVVEDLQDRVPPVAQIDVLDIFATQNDFFGGEIGYETDWKYRRWSLNFLSKVAIGSTRQRVAIAGQTLRNGTELNPPDNTGGLLAQRTVLADDTVVGNIGSYERDEFSMIPEIGLTLGYNLTRRLKLTGGYTLLYWSNVVRPGDQIDIDVNANMIPRDGGPAAGSVVPGDHPRFTFRQTDLWAHGLNLGAEMTW